MQVCHLIVSNGTDHVGIDTSYFSLRPGVRPLCPRLAQQCAFHRPKVNPSPPTILRPSVFLSAVPAPPSCPPNSSPSHAHKKLSDVETLFVNFHSLLNRYRAHQVQVHVLIYPLSPPTGHPSRGAFPCPSRHIPLSLEYLARFGRARIPDEPSIKGGSFLHTRVLCAPLSSLCSHLGKA